MAIIVCVVHRLKERILLGVQASLVEGLEKYSAPAKMLSVVR